MLRGFQPPLGQRSRCGAKLLGIRMIHTFLYTCALVQASDGFWSSSFHRFFVIQIHRQEMSRAVLSWISQIWFKSRKSSRRFWGREILNFLHTRSMSPCQPVNERCHHCFFARYLVVPLFFLGGGILNLKESQTAGEKQKRNSHPSSTGRQGLNKTRAQKFRINLLKKGVNIWGVLCGKHA